MFQRIRHNTKWKHLKDTFLYVFYYGAGTLMPIWLGMLLLALFDQPIGLTSFIDQGQFAIYSAAAITPLIYILVKNHKGLESASYTLVLIICLIVSALIFTVADSRSLPLFTLEPNKEYIRVSSICIYGFSLLAIFFIQLHESTYDAFDMQADQQTRVGSLEASFDRELNST